MYHIIEPLSNKYVITIHVVNVHLLFIETFSYHLQQDIGSVVLHH